MLIFIYRKETFNNLREGVFMKNNHNKDYNPPMMGWSSWNAFKINLNEDIVKEQTRLMKELGLLACGYSYINIEDGFFGGREKNKVLYSNDKFSSGMKSLAKFIHSEGFRAGIYTDVGRRRCASYSEKDPNFNKGGGSYGFRNIDFKTFIDTWDYDFVKVAFCGGKWQKLDIKKEYTNIANEISKLKKKARWEIASGSFPGVWASEISNQWRVSKDNEANFYSILNTIDKSNTTQRFSSSNHYNHLGPLVIGEGMSYDEDIAHFTMWSILNSPLIISTDLNKLSRESLSILSNKEIIALNQDSLAVQGQRIYKEQRKEIYFKPLDNYNKAAVVLFNRSRNDQVITVNWKDIGIDSQASVRDLWKHEYLGSFKQSFSALVKSHSVVALEVSGDDLVSYPIQEVDLNDLAKIKIYFNDLVIDKISSLELEIKSGSDYVLSDDNFVITEKFLSKLDLGKHKFTVHYTNNSEQKLFINVIDSSKNKKILGVKKKHLIIGVSVVSALGAIRLLRSKSSKSKSK